MRRSWLNQIVTIENKGYDAYLAGKATSDNPYWDGYRNNNGPGGSLQKQRRDAWERGWRNAKRDKESEENNHVEV
jgi:ribosome modulation factor